MVKVEVFYEVKVGDFFLFYKMFVVCIDIVE